MYINANSNGVYRDYPLYKKTTPNGELKLLEDSDALAQAIQIWISSEKGEKVRNRGGGILAPFLGKTMDNDVAKDMEVCIRQQLKDEFNPPIEVVYIKVTPDKEKEQWIIEIAGYNANLSVGVNTSMTIINM